MKKLKIEWLWDEGPNCDCCGPSYAMGYRAYLDGELISEFEPIAACFDGDSIEESEAYSAIFKALGYELETSEGEL